MTHNRMCVLTKRRKLINEEITIRFGDKKYNIGVSEVEVFWHPFKTCVGNPMDVRITVEDYTDPESTPSCDDEDDEDENEEVFFEEEMNNNNMDMEDGEIPPEDGRTPAVQKVGGHTPEAVNSENKEKSPERRATFEIPVTVEVEIPYVPAQHVPCESKDATSGMGPFRSPFSNPLSELVPLGCFGPFPSPFINPSEPNSSGLPKKKRKRVISGNRKSKSSKSYSSPNRTRNSTSPSHSPSPPEHPAASINSPIQTPTPTLCDAL
ncbi:hypothetical protein LXL04_007096 [Taraxacum kok-saghyz]